MSHPVELLVALEDGTLDLSERAVLDAHLAGCARFRAEAEAATRGRGALRSLPAEPLPAGLLDEVHEEARRLAAAGGSTVVPLGGAGRGARLQRYVAAAGAAAAILLVVAIALPRVGGDDVRETDAVGPAAESLSQARATVVEVMDTDLDLAEVQALATSYAVAASEPRTGDAPTPGGVMSAGATAEPGPPASLDPEVDPAVACLTDAYETLPGEPVRLIRARYLGARAYLAVIPVAPAADEPPTSIQVLVATVDDCTARGSTTVALGE